MAEEESQCPLLRAPARSHRRAADPECLADKRYGRPVMEAAHAGGVVLAVPGAPV